MFDNERENMRETTRFNAEQKRKAALQKERDHDLTGQDEENFIED